MFKPWSEISPRERDALVAERVMGWRNMHRDVEPFLPPLTDGKIDLKYLRWADREGRFVVSPPPYSTDIAAAWEVVERIALDKSFILEVWPIQKKWHCSIDRGQKYSVTDTAPEAICLAALRAVGVEIE